MLASSHADNGKHWRKTKEQRRKENYDMKTWIKEQMQKLIMCWLNVLINFHRKYIWAKMVNGKWLFKNGMSLIKLGKVQLHLNNEPKWKHNKNEFQCM